MNKYSTVTEMQSAANSLRSEGRRIVLVPTSGAIHAGHRSMMKEARRQGDIVVVSIFVNPLQFGANENISKYPRPIEEDLAACEAEGVDAVFMPSVEDFYPKGYSSYVTEEAVAKPLCGVSRPNHFRGVATFMVKVLNIVQAQTIVLGQLDAQMAAMLKKLLVDLNIQTTVAMVPTERDKDGLALHVRNANLTTSLRLEASAVYQALLRAKEMSDSGVKSVDRVIAEVTHILRQQRRVRVIYISIVDPSTMEPLREVIPGSSLLVIAAWIEEIRLTDNIML